MKTPITLIIMDGFGLSEENSIVRVVRGEEIGTTVKNKF